MGNRVDFLRQWFIQIGITSVVGSCWCYDRNWLGVSWTFSKCQNRNRYLDIICIPQIDYFFFTLDITRWQRSPAIIVTNWCERCRMMKVLKDYSPPDQNFWIEFIKYHQTFSKFHFHLRKCWKLDIWTFLLIGKVSTS